MSPKYFCMCPHLNSAFFKVWKTLNFLLATQGERKKVTTFSKRKMNNTFCLGNAGFPRRAHSLQCGLTGEGEEVRGKAVTISNCPFQAQMQFKKSLHREARINDQKLRDHEAEKILPSVSRSDDDDLLATSGQMDRCLGESCNLLVKSFFQVFLELHQMNYTVCVDRQWSEKRMNSLGFLPI